MAKIFAFDANIYRSSSRLFKIDLVISLEPETHRQYIILALPLPFHWLRVSRFFLNKIPYRINRVVIQASDIAKCKKVLVIL